MALLKILRCAKLRCCSYCPQFSTDHDDLTYLMGGEERWLGLRPATTGNLLEDQFLMDLRPMINYRFQRHESSVSHTKTLSESSEK